MEKITLIVPKDLNYVRFVSGPDYAQLFIGKHVALAQNYIRQYMPNWQPEAQVDSAIVAFSRSSRLDPNQYKFFCYTRLGDDAQEDRKLYKRAIDNLGLGYTWVDVAKLVCPGPAVVYKRTFVPYWVPKLGGRLLSEKPVSGTLTVEETREGWEFSHPGFEGGKFFLPCLNVDSRPGVGTPQLYFL